MSRDGLIGIALVAPIFGLVLLVGAWLIGLATAWAVLSWACVGALWVLFIVRRLPSSWKERWQR